VSARLIEGEKGEFTVKADDKIIFSKASVGRFPEDYEISRLLELGPGPAHETR
jgi:hypothetical protein